MRIRVAKNSCTRYSVVGISSLAILCAGDGAAGLFGAKFNGSKLPWNRSKTWLGFTSFIIAGSVAVSWFTHLSFRNGWISAAVYHAYQPQIMIIVFLCAILESLPIVGEWDNIVVFIGSLVVHKLLGF